MQVAVLHRKIIPRYFTLGTQRIELPLIVITHWAGLHPPKVINWLFSGLNLISDDIPYELHICDVYGSSKVGVVKSMMF